MNETPLRAGQTWDDAQMLTPQPLKPVDWLRILRRAVPAILGIVILLLLLLAVRVIERPLAGERRPWTLTIKRWGCVWALFCMGLKLRVTGKMMRGQGAVVCNHTGWLDIFTMGAAAELTFISKAEVAAWPGIGALAKATGTLFIRRDPREAAAQVQLLQSRFAAGQRLLFFPEGTSTDNQRVLPFKTTLFGSLIGQDIAVQPVSLRYVAPEGEDPRFYGWWGGMDFVPHLLMVLAAPKQGHVEILAQPPLFAKDFAHRKDLALAAQSAVRAGYEDLLVCATTSKSAESE